MWPYIWIMTILFIINMHVQAGNYPEIFLFGVLYAMWLQTLIDTANWMLT